MKKNQILLDPEQMEKFRGVALKNSKSTTNQSFVDIAIQIALDVIRFMEDEEFENLTQLKK